MYIHIQMYIRYQQYKVLYTLKWNMWEYSNIMTVYMVMKEKSYYSCLYLNPSEKFKPCNAMLAMTTCWREQFFFNH